MENRIMSYDTVIEQIKAVPHECLNDVENYIQFVLYRRSRNAKQNSESIKLFWLRNIQ